MLISALKRVSWAESLVHHPPHGIRALASCKQTLSEPFLDWDTVAAYTLPKGHLPDSGLPLALGQASVISDFAIVSLHSPWAVPTASWEGLVDRAAHYRH